jgi:hypothetical protein
MAADQPPPAHRAGVSDESALKGRVGVRKEPLVGEPGPRAFPSRSEDLAAPVRPVVEAAVQDIDDGVCRDPSG